MLDRTQFTWPDYREILVERLRESDKLLAHPDYAEEVRKLYAEDPLAFFRDWASTFDPRNAGTDKLTVMPFVLFPRQEQLVDAIYQSIKTDAHLLIEKSRDMGATWLCCWISIHLFLFVPGCDVGWGSRKSDSVDQLGVMSSILEKIRWALRRLPPELLPLGWSEDCMSYMRILNPQTGSSIIGECGDNIGRGGRTRVYFKDESAHYERPEKIQAALDDNTRVQIDISSVNNTGNLFWRKRQASTEWTPSTRMESGHQYAFIMDWRDHPDKTQEWYDTRKARQEAEGTMHLFAQEVDRDYSASVVGTIIPAEWIRACVDAHLKFPGREAEFYVGGTWVGLDVADNTRPTGDKNACVIRTGWVVRAAEDWAAPDTGVTTRRAIAMVSSYLPKLGESGRVTKFTEVHYDCIGVGAGVKAEANRLQSENLMPKGLKFVAWDAGQSPLNPDAHMGKIDQLTDDPNTPLNKDFYGNLKAQGWMELRTRVWKTYQALTENKYFKVSEMISFDSKIPKIQSLITELSQPVQKPPTGTMLFYVDKTPDGTRSPNLGDACMQCCWPVPASYADMMKVWIG